MDGGTTRRAAPLVLVGLIVLTSVAVLQPPELVVRGSDLVTDPVQDRVDAEGNDGGSQVVVRLSATDGGELLGDLDRLRVLLDLERQLVSGTVTGPHGDELNGKVQHLDAFATSLDAHAAAHGTSLVAATSWDDLVDLEAAAPCAGNASPEAQASMAAWVLLAPADGTPGYLCPDLPGGHPRLPPSADATVWVLRLDHEPTEGIPVAALDAWLAAATADHGLTHESSSTEHLLGAARETAWDDLARWGPWMIIAVLILLGVGLGTQRAWVATVGGLLLAGGATVGTLTLLGHVFTLIDLVGLPLLLAVGVDGPAWHRRGGLDRARTRGLLAIAALTTAATMVPAASSPVPALAGLARLVIVGVFFDWLVTRGLLEPWLRADLADPDAAPRPPEAMPTRAFAPTPRTSVLARPLPLALALLVLLPGLLAPIWSSPDAAVQLDLRQFLADDDPLHDRLDALEAEFVIGGTRLVPIIVDPIGDADDPALLAGLWSLERSLEHLPGVMHVDLVTGDVPLVSGPATQLQLRILEDPTNATSLQWSASGPVAAADAPALSSLLGDGASGLLEHDPVLRDADGQVTGYLILVVLDVRDLAAGAAFAEAFDALEWPRPTADAPDATIVAGGAIVESGRILDDVLLAEQQQVLLATLALATVGLVATRRLDEALLLALGGLSVAGITSLVATFSPEGRGLMTTPAVLLALGVGADYLAHALHARRHGHAARWLAASTSLVAFAFLTQADFPPVRQFAILLITAVLSASVLATIWARLLAPGGHPDAPSSAPRPHGQTHPFADDPIIPLQHASRAEGAE